MGVGGRQSSRVLDHRDKRLFVLDVVQAIVQDLAAMVPEPLLLAGRAEGLTGSAEHVEMDPGHIALGVVAQYDISVK